jgi:PBP1b-binding outer membrane lipoprotein LpoB
LKIMNIFIPLRLSQTLQYPSAVLASVLLIAGCSGIPPTEQIAVSKAAVNTASSAGGTQFAPVPMRTAMEKMDAAEQAMVTKDYPLALRLAEQAQVDAQLAASTARSIKAQNAATELQQSNRVLRQEIDRSTQ